MKATEPDNPRKFFLPCGKYPYYMAAEPKTRPTNIKPKDFISTVKDEQKRKDSLEVLKMMEKITGEKGVMWGSGIIGFGSVKLRYASGKELDWPKTGFSPRAQ